MNYHEELAAARKHLAMAMTFTDNNPLKETVLRSARNTIEHCERQIAWNEHRARCQRELEQRIAAYNALPFFRRLFASNPAN